MLDLDYADKLSGIITGFITASLAIPTTYIAWKTSKTKPISPENIAVHFSDDQQ